MYITVVGRAKTVREFIEEISDLLYDGFNIVAWHTLGEPGVDEKERFLIFITADGETEHDFETQAARLQSSNTETPRSAHVFEDLNEALEYAKENYGLGEDKAQAHEQWEHLTEEFPPITAEEKEKLELLDTYIKMGRITPLSAKIDDERVIALCLITKGPDELRVTPMAIMANEEILDNLELPMEED